jgi:hypothetical protein
MKNKDFFYQQYEKINWENQEKTKINSFVNDFILQEIILQKKSEDIKIFDIGFGIGFFFKMIYPILSKKYENILLEGCEPSNKNFNYFTEHSLNVRKNANLKTHNSTFLNTQTDEKFDFITAIYTFTNFVTDELEVSAEKIYSMLENGGQFILVVANEKYLEEKLASMKDLFIEKNSIEFDGKKYKEVLHYSDIPKIGKIIDYNREEQFYLDLFKKKNFKLAKKENFDDNGFRCTIFVFEKLG